MSNPQSEIRNPKSLLPPPQFGLRTLLLVMSGCAVIFAMSNWLSPIALAGVVMLVLSVLAHVAGNAIGTRLRELGTPSALQAPRQQFARPDRSDFAPATRLGQRYSLGWPIILGTAAGTLAGGVGGGAWALTHSAGRPDILSVAVGSVAFAVLNGIAAFVIVGFLQVGIGAIRQALKHSQS